MRATLLLLPAIALAQPVRVVGQPPEETDPRQPGAFAERVAVEDLPGAADLGALLAPAVSAHVRRHGGPGARSTLQLRGAGAHQVLVLLDDLPLGGARGGAFDLSAVPLAFLEELELIRGPAAALWGGGAQGGVLRLRTRRVAGDALELRARRGSFDYGAADAGYARSWARGDLLVVGSLSGAEGDFPFEDLNGARRRRANNAHQRGGALVKGGAALGGGRLQVLLEGVALARGEPGPEQSPAAAQSTQRRAQAAVGWSLEGPLRAQATLQARYQDHRFEDPGALDGAELRRNSDDLLGTRLALGAPWGAVDSELVVEARRESGSGFSRKTGAVVLVETLKPWSWLVLSAATRLEDTDERSPVFVPRGGLVLELPARLELRANLGRIHRDPSFDELFFEARGLRGDPELRREDGWSWDAGLRWRFSRFEAEVALFEQRFERIILFTPVNAFLVQATDDFGATIRGLEARAAWRWRRHALQLSYTGLDHAFSHTPHSPLPHRPDHRLYAALELPIGEAHARLAYDWRDRVKADRLGHRELPAYDTWGLGLHGPLGAGFVLGLQIDNLLDEAGHDAAQIPLPGRSFMASLRCALR